MGLPGLTVASGAAARCRPGRAGGGPGQEPSTLQRVGAPRGPPAAGRGPAPEAVHGSFAGGAAVVRCAVGGSGGVLLLGQRHDPGDEALAFGRRAYSYVEFTPNFTPSARISIGFFY